MAETWQKVGLVTAALTAVLPWAAINYWKIIFPPNYLIYSAQIPIKNEEFGAFTVLVQNQGSSRQEDVKVTMASSTFSYSSVDISKARPSRFFTTLDLEKWQPLSKTNDSYVVELGNIEPGEISGFEIIGHAKAFEYFLVNNSSFRVESKQSTGIYGNLEDPFARDESTAHGFFQQISIFFFPIIVALIVLAYLFGIIYSSLFYTDEAEMGRLWKRMDALQEKMEKTRRYR